MDYHFKEIERKWQKFWAENQTFKADNNSSKPKYYVLDMFPYPSGAGLHVGHPLGYIASDIFARYKRLRGFNVLHPMGYDSFGLPAEQYAIQTGQHPAITTEANINTYRRQLDQIGFSFDWSREVRTSSPDFYKWTQWIFMQLFNSWYNKSADKAESIEKLVKYFEQNGSAGVDAVCDEDVLTFTAAEWMAMSNRHQQEELLKYRLTYLRESTVNWCPALGTVLANDEVKDGFSERGGYPVEQKKMTQWSMRITAYAERLLQGLDTIDWPDPVSEMQRNWIGKSVGASVRFTIYDLRFTNGNSTDNRSLITNNYIEVFTTRVDTIFGVTFMVLAPEHELVPSLTTPQQKAEIETYIAQTKKKSELDRMADAKTVSGAFTGSYVVNPVNDEKVPIYIADYVLAGYGTGAVMAVPSGDQRDYLFAKHFGLPIVPIMDIQKIETEADPTKEGRYINSAFMNGLNYKDGIAKVIEFLESKGMGKAKINYRMRDAIFGRQRYWGEPVPVYFKDDLPHLIDEKDLPLILPEVDKYLPTETGEPPLARAKNWKHAEGAYEHSTMPGWAGSSWYWYRYMDAHNDKEFASRQAIDYWRDVDLYIGGSEHATGHLLYSRFWNKFLRDLGLVPEEEPFKKLINQGHIQGRSNFVYRLFFSVQPISDNARDVEKISMDYKYNDIVPVTYISYDLLDRFNNDPNYKNEVIASVSKTCEKELNEIGGKLEYTQTMKRHVDVNLVDNDVLEIEKFKENHIKGNSVFITNKNGDYICNWEIEKMSKSKYNVVNPDTLVERYGADTLRMYEMFLGPLEQSKPWNTNGIEGAFKFLRKFWKLFHDEQFNFRVSDEAPSKAELKSLHKIIRKVEEDIDRFSFNTSVSSFMIAVNELTDLKCSKRAILQDLVIVLSPYAPHICEELWVLLGNKAGTLSYAPYPKFNPEYLVEDEFAYPISVNGKMKINLNISLALESKEIEDFVLASPEVQKYLDGKSPKKVIVVKGRIVNIVI
ncbi:MAG TPA: class I tRNA ligase family protein [Mucilaginibacter sp.]|jgi:leucyl-tRNA synthetase|nr:class I tRNA ligase family protein [Mucilaginibacter sp.]